MFDCLHVGAGLLLLFDEPLGLAQPLVQTAALVVPRIELLVLAFDLLSEVLQPEEEQDEDTLLILTCTKPTNSDFTLLSEHRRERAWLSTEGSFLCFYSPKFENPHFSFLLTGLLCAITLLSVGDQQEYLESDPEMSVGKGKAGGGPAILGKVAR